MIGKRIEYSYRGRLNLDELKRWYERREGTPPDIIEFNVDNQELLTDATSDSVITPLAGYWPAVVITAVLNDEFWAQLKSTGFHFWKERHGQSRPSQNPLST